ncbi:hypothetical protein, partial [Streptomyces galilaeus]|uniref:hypothetical protein n=1 Tax=Streptomyces galilaeus TaxID=33899 RepID=UPI0038F795C1
CLSGYWFWQHIHYSFLPFIVFVICTITALNQIHKKDITMRALITCSALLMLGACSSVTIQPQQVAKLSSKPSYQDSRPFFM